MSWPPDVFDLSLTDKLLEQQRQQWAAQAGILDISRELEALSEARNSSAAPANLIPRLEALIASAQQKGQPDYAAEASLLLAQTLLEAKRPQEALAQLEAGRAAWTSQRGQQEAAERATDARFLARMAEARFQMQDYAAVSSLCGEAIGKIELDRYKTSAAYLQSSYLKSRINVYKHGIGAAYKLGDYETMLARAELTKARSLLRYAPEKAAPDLENERRFRDVSTRLSQQEREGNGDEVSRLQEERRNLWDLLTIARLRPNTESPHLPEFSLARIQSALAADEAVLYYYWLDSGVLLVSLIGREEFRVKGVETGTRGQQCLRDVLNGIRLFPGAMGDREQRLFDRAIQGCSYLLPGDFAPVLEKKQRLIVCPHQKLHLFPFHALPWNEGALIQKFAVSYIPNLTILGMPPRAHRPPKVLLYSAGQYDRALQLPKLAEAGPETAGAAEAYRRQGAQADVPGATQLTENLLWQWSDDGRLAGYSVIHLATHGVSVFARESLNDPMQSQVFLNAAALDGMEISRLRLDADLVVLSACNSGQRAIEGRGMEELPGDDLFGLQGAFAMAGARAVLGCLWPVMDGVARDIMIGFHQRYAGGVSPELALQQATVEHLRPGTRGGCHNWAPFFLSILGSRTYA